MSTNNHHHWKDEDKITYLYRARLGNIFFRYNFRRPLMPCISVLYIYWSIPVFLPVISITAVQGRVFLHLRCYNSKLDRFPECNKSYNAKAFRSRVWWAHNYIPKSLLRHHVIQVVCGSGAGKKWWFPIPPPRVVMKDGHQNKQQPASQPASQQSIVMK